MKSIIVRGIDRETETALKKASEKFGRSVNATIIAMIKEALGLDKKHRTNVYSAFKVGNAEVLERLQSAEYIGVNAIVLGEQHGGFKIGKKEKQNLAELEEFLSLDTHFRAVAGLLLA